MQVTIATTWFKGMVSVSTGDTSRFIIHDAIMIDINQYQSVLTFNTLSSTRDTGTYTCTVVVNSNFEYVANSNSVSGLSTVSVGGKQ